MKGRRSQKLTHVRACGVHVLRMERCASGLVRHCGNRDPAPYLARGVYRSDPNFDSHSYTTTRIPLRRGRRGKCRNACGRRDSHAQRPMLAADASHTRGPGGTCRHARAHMRDSRRHRRERGRSGARSNGNRPAKNASRKSCGSCLTTRVGGRERRHQLCVLAKAMSRTPTMASSWSSIGAQRAEHAQNSNGF